MYKIEINRPILPQGTNIWLNNKIWKELTIRVLPSVDIVKNRIMIGL